MALIRGASAAGAGVDIAGQSPVFGEHSRSGPTTLFSESATSRRRFCVTGQHTDVILTEMGCSAERNADQRERKAIR